MSAPVETLLAEAERHSNDFRFADALAIYRHVLSEQSDHLGAAAGIARCLFGLEQWDAAWQAYDVRFALMKRPVVTRMGKDNTPEPFPVWREGPPPKRLLILPEQGIGDTIQFSRFVPQLAAAGVGVQMVVDRKIARLLKPVLPGVRVIASDGQGQVRGVDAICMLLELPRLMKLKPESFVPEMPYVRVEADRVHRWQRALIAAGKLNVGIAWRGNPAMSADQHRSAPIAALAPLADHPRVRLISLQMGEGRDQISDVPFGSRVIVPPPEFDTGPDAFLDTAALMASLDLVVSVDTSICHLAGALARPVWIGLTANGPDWRWLGRMHDTPWYPTARLYRQRSIGDWREVFERMAADLNNRLPMGGFA